MNPQKHSFVLITAIIVINLMVACGPVSSVAQSEESSDISNAERTTGYLTTQDGRLLEYSLLIPVSWNNKFEIRKEGNAAYFDYAARPKQTIFSLEALTAEQWQEAQQAPGYGEELFSRDEIIYVYHSALDNPYTDRQAEEFQQLAGQVKNIVSSLTVSVATHPNEMVGAGKVLINFFCALSRGNYTEAATLYGGSYENLIDLNPEIDPSEHVTLLENACLINGFQCLPVLQVVRGRQEWPDTFVFTLEFSNPDGSLFTRGPCCGASGTSDTVLSRFDFTVKRIPQSGNIFLVQDLPVYVP